MEATTKINDRIQVIVDEMFDGNKAKFSKKVGVPSVTVQNIVGKRETDPSAMFLGKIARSIKSINTGWLLTGEGEMLKEYELPVNEVQMVNDPSYSEMEVIRSQSRTIEAQSRTIEDQATLIKKLTDMLLSKPTQKGFIQDTERVG